ncbi:MAG: prepilin peptidase [Deltaproteobacteria bacterium]|nr:MAG: prepilin peptidase [Deltaproteobacteria bacterium]
MIDLATYSPTPLEGLVALALILAIYNDLSSRKIPNRLTFPLWGIGVVWHLLAGLLGTGEWWFGLLGLAVTLPLHFGLFAIGLDRGGDAKLMAGVGACLGWWIGVEATLWGILLMLPVSLLYATFAGKLPNVGRTLLWFLKQPYYRFMRLEPGEPPPQTYIPKAPIIAIAVLTARFTTFAEAWFFDTPP